MGRYRPPRASGSPYITPEGETALRAELHALWKIERPEVTKAVSAAAANGDRSENGDYIYYESYEEENMQDHNGALQ